MERNERSREPMKVLVLGGAGFIGSVLCPYLRERGDEVTVVDAFLFEERTDTSLPYALIRGDIRNAGALLPAVDEADAVVNLAAVSNDPASDLAPELAWETNYKANELISQLCQATKKRVVHASSCSVYGFSDGDIFDEESQLDPVTLYAQTKMLSEQCYLHKEVDAVIFRLATVYGYSPKPRFDLVVNTMIGSGFFNGKVMVKGGNQWRPIVHVKDVARAIYMALHAESLGHKIYNVGSNEQNYQVGTLGALVAQSLPNAELIHEKDGRDKRSYRVDFGLIEKDLQFQTEFGLGDAVSELCSAFSEGLIRSLDRDVYYRVKYLRGHGKDVFPKKSPHNSCASPRDTSRDRHSES
jgi:nucleoside-diphosphate-sugar epimerase